MREEVDSTDLGLGIDTQQLLINRAHRAQLRLIHEFDAAEEWRAYDCYDMAQWLAPRLGITVAEALRRTYAAHALEKLSWLAKSLEDGTLSLEKVVQLARFMTPENERELIRWARRVTVNAVRERANLETRKTLDDLRESYDSRFLSLWPCDSLGSLAINGRLPAPQGALFKRTIEEIASRLDPLPDEDDWDREKRYADALIELTLAGSGGSPRKPTLIVHTTMDSLQNDAGGTEVEGAAAVHPEIARRVSCDSRLQIVLHDENGRTVGIGRASRVVPDWLRREVLRRDRGCVFCGTRRYVDCHHVVPWSHGGTTDLDNLVLLCNFHHTLVHEGGWRVELDEQQVAVWFRPDGSRYERGLVARPPIFLRMRFTPEELIGDLPDADATSTGPRRSAAMALIAAAFG